MAATTTLVKLWGPRTSPPPQPPHIQIDSVLTKTTFLYRLPLVSLWTLDSSCDYILHVDCRTLITWLWLITYNWGFLLGLENQIWWSVINIKLRFFKYLASQLINVPWRRSDVIMRPFWSHIEAILRSYWSHFKVLLRPFWSHIEAILRSFWCHFKVLLRPFLSHIEAILRSYWGHFEIILKPCWANIEARLIAKPSSTLYRQLL